MVKFSSQIDERALKKLRALAKQTDQNLSKLITEAVVEYLDRAGLRPEFREATEKVLSENSDLLARLGK